MEREALITAMKVSISEVLEKMFFLPLDFPEAGNEKEFMELKADEIMISKLNFSGPLSGYFQFFIPRGLAFSIAASFMGIGEDSISREHVTETVKEIINMFAGNTFSIFDSQSVFDLDIPELIDSEKEGKENVESREEIFIPIYTMESRVALKMFIR